MFFVRTIDLALHRHDTASYDMTPADDEGRRVCDLFDEFLAGKPPEFRARLPFLRKDLELEWTAAPGGVALASFHDAESPRTMGILLAGVDSEADRIMLNAWRENLLRPLLGDDAVAFSDCAERPALVNVVFPGSAELVPALQMMAAALASVHFRCMIQMHHSG